MQSIVRTTVILFACAMAPSAVLAHDAEGTAVGGAASLGATSGLLVQFHPGSFVVELTAGLGFTSFSDDATDDALTLDVSGGLLFNLVSARDTHLQFGGHAGLSFDSENDNAAFTLDAMLRVEHWLSPRFSIQPGVGIVLRIDPGDFVALNAGNTGFFGGANFVFYLDDSMEGTDSADES